MDSRIVIEGGTKLSGNVKISGSKNAALPILAATILSDQKITLNNLPHLADIATMTNLLLSLGSKATFATEGHSDSAKGRTIIFDNSNINNLTAHYDIVSKMRASILVLGPLLSKYGEAKVSLPGGCAIGSRPVNLHLTALEELGAEINIEDGYVIAKAAKGLVGTEINFPTISVGATENIIMAACLAHGTTILNNAAIEPEIIDLINFLNKVGSEITVKDRQITIVGKKSLNGGSHAISADRIEAGSYAVAALSTKGSITFTAVNQDIFAPIEAELKALGGIIKHDNDNITISYDQSQDNSDNLNIETGVYPDFPTDMQAQFSSLLCLKNISSSITETIFENRFMHISELQRMGANIAISGNKIDISPSSLSGAEVTATDLRASMALIIAALNAKGTTIIHKTHHLDRGYELLEEKLSKLGAKIQRQY